MRINRFAGALITLAALTNTAAAAEPPPRLDLPVACEIGATCFVQQYVDHDDGKGYRDYRCGSLSNNGHGGTDIRLPNFAAMDRGVAVLAAASGVVRAVRDAMPDVSSSLVGHDAVNDRGLGNVVVIGHGGGWRTFYGHMCRGSIAVRKGDVVKAGQKLGLIGLSGLSEYPHVHFELRQGKRIVDPFTGPGEKDGCGPGDAALWKPAVLAGLDYDSTFLLHAGFSVHPMNRPALQYGLYDRDTLPRKAGRLYFAIFLAGLHADDRYNLRLTDSDGATLYTEDRVVDRPGAVHFRSAGIERDKPLPAGTYRAQFLLSGVRDGEYGLVLDVKRTVTLR